MDKKTIGMVLGVTGVVLWFMPLVSLGSSGFYMYQAGHHIGGIAYLLIISSAVYAVSSWFLNMQVSIIAASVSSAISMYFLLQAGSNAGFGLVGLLAVSTASIIYALKFNTKTSTLVKTEEIEESNEEKRGKSYKESDIQPEDRMFD